jgi:hypothetical protein
MSELRDHLAAAGAGADDLAWFDRIGWSDAQVPAARAGDVADYRRREKLLNDSLAGLTFAERGTSQAGRLAAAIGARIADLRDADDEDEA